MPLKKPSSWRNIRGSKRRCIKNTPLAYDSYNNENKGGNVDRDVCNISDARLYVNKKVTKRRNLDELQLNKLTTLLIRDQNTGKSKGWLLWWSGLQYTIIIALQRTLLFVQAN